MDLDSFEPYSCRLVFIHSWMSKNLTTMWLFQLDLFLVLQSGIFGEAGVDRLFYFASVWQTLLSTFAGHLS